MSWNKKKFFHNLIRLFLKDYSLLFHILPCLCTGLEQEYLKNDMNYKMTVDYTGELSTFWCV